MRLCEKSLYRVTVSLLSNRSDAEDAMQEALCCAYEKLHTLKEAEKFRPWLLKIASNAAYDILRRRGRTVPLEEIEPAVSDTTGEAMSEREARSVLGRNEEGLRTLYLEGNRAKFDALVLEQLGSDDAYHAAKAEDGDAGEDEPSGEAEAE